MISNKNKSGRLLEHRPMSPLTVPYLRLTKPLIDCLSQFPSHSFPLSLSLSQFSPHSFCSVLPARGSGTPAASPLFPLLWAGSEPLLPSAGASAGTGERGSRSNTNRLMNTSAHSAPKALSTTSRVLLCCSCAFTNRSCAACVSPRNVALHLPNPVLSNARLAFPGSPLQALPHFSVQVLAS